MPWKIFLLKFICRVGSIAGLINIREMLKKIPLPVEYLDTSLKFVILQKIIGSVHTDDWLAEYPVMR